MLYPAHTQHGKLRKSSIKTLRSSFSAKFGRHCVFSGAHACAPAPLPQGLLG